MVRQLGLFGGAAALPELSCRRLQSQARLALGRYAAGAALPSFGLRTLAEEQARLELLRRAARRLAKREGRRGSKLRRVQYLISPAGARVYRAIERCVRRIEELEAVLLCA